jgi:sRNA-binding carbon storage regulator CsrA
MLMIKRKVLKEWSSHEHNKCKFKIFVNDKTIEISVIERRGSWISLCVDAPMDIIIKRNEIINEQKQGE